MNMNDTYQKLVNALKRIEYLSSSLGLLSWDEQVLMPKGSAEYRSKQTAALAEIVHREQTLPEIGDWLSALEDDSANLSEEQQIVVRESRRDYDLSVNIPSEFVSRDTQHKSNAYHAWVEARSKSDYSLFKDWLQGNLDLAKEKAGFFGFEKKDAYDFLIDLHDPGMKAETVDNLFSALKKDLIPLVNKILNSPIKADKDILKGFPEDKQKAFLDLVTKKIGFDYNRGRMDIAVHPFCSGNPSDTRMTTRYDVDNPLDSLFSSIHESGHGLYQQGLLQKHQGTPLAEHVGMAIHESQSRFWENQVGRSRGFWKYWEPHYRETFAQQLKDISSDELYLAVNAVRQNPIRVDSDEITYNLHIILRFEIEKALFYGELDLEELPVAWNQKAYELLGLKIDNDTNGVLQDVHWSYGAFGYFPSYCLGNMIAAQIWNKVNQVFPNLDNDFAQGQFEQVLQWNRENIHHPGRKFNTLELIERATGKKLSPDSLITYMKDRYLPLYCQ